jgi:proline iminopeptidase
VYAIREPFTTGDLDVDDGHTVRWEVCGSPRGKPAVVLHGGPGSGCTARWRRFVDPDRYFAVFFDQRGCGRSTPHASDWTTDLSTNTTRHLVGDIERLREHLGVDHWLVLGGSWGSTLALAYSVEHPDRVSEAVLFAVTATRRDEVAWATRHVGRYFPKEWRRFRDGVPPEDREGDLAAAYARLLRSPDRTVREQAARDWCAWEDTHVRVDPRHGHNPRYDDPDFRMAFARLVTHYWSNAAFLPDGALLEGARELGHVPAVLVHGRRDLSTPLETAWLLAHAWPGSRLVVVDDAGHTGDRDMDEAVVAATDGYAKTPA